MDGFFLLLAVASGAAAFVLGRQTVRLTDDEIIATQGFRRLRVAWSDIECVHLDWAAEAAGRDRDVLRIEREDGEPLRSSAAMGMGLDKGGGRNAEAMRLEAALRDRGRDHGFAVDVVWPSWMSNATDGREVQPGVE